MGTLRRKSSHRIHLPKEDQDTLVPCPRCKGNGRVVIQDDGRLYRTLMCKWCQGSGGVNRDLIRAWRRLERWIKYYTDNKIPFRF